MTSQSVLIHFEITFALCFSPVHGMTRRIYSRVALETLTEFMGSQFSFYHITPAKPKA